MPQQYLVGSLLNPYQCNIDILKCTQFKRLFYVAVCSTATPLNIALVATPLNIALVATPLNIALAPHSYYFDVNSFTLIALFSVAGTFMNNEGSGLYALQSTCNHSCEPNAEVTFPYSNSTLAVKATKSIKSGEEIFISYVDECCLERSRHSRQKELR